MPKRDTKSPAERSSDEYSVDEDPKHQAIPTYDHAGIPDTVMGLLAKIALVFGFVICRGGAEIVYAQVHRLELNRGDVKVH